MYLAEPSPIFFFSDARNRCTWSNQLDGDTADINRWSRKSGEVVIAQNPARSSDGSQDSH